ncbi:hypothetical protein PMAYCL1PPCAC_17731, partial [Pristionchus mayeri]
RYSSHECCKMEWYGKCLNSVTLFLLPMASPLLEGVDAEWLIDELTARPTPSIYTSISVIIALLLSGLLYPPLVFSIPLLLSSLFLPYALTRLFVFLSNQLNDSIRKLFVALKARQAAAFSLRMDPSRSGESIRRSMLIHLREVALAIGEVSAHIAKNDEEESGRLLLSFCTPEMESLLNDPISPYLISISSLKTVWELVILLESEFLRLLLLFLPVHPFLITKLLFQITKRIRAVNGELHECHSRLHSMSFLNDSKEEKKSVKVDESTLVLQLEMIIECLRSSNLNVDGAMRTLRDIVSSHSLSSINNPLVPPIPRGSGSIEEEAVPLIPAAPKPLRDELFECVGEGREDGMRREEEEEGGRRDERSGEIMSELKVRLEEKAEEWKERERRVRREMGKEDEEEEEEEKGEDEVKEEREEKIPELPLDERSHDLHSQIASLIRRRKTGKEEIIGSEESSSDTE